METETKLETIDLPTLRALIRRRYVADFVEEMRALGVDNVGLIESVIHTIRSSYKQMQYPSESENKFLAVALDEFINLHLKETSNA